MASGKDRMKIIMHLINSIYLNTHTYIYRVLGCNDTNCTERESEEPYVDNVFEKNTTTTTKT